MNLDGAIDGLRTALSTMTGLKRTYTDPPSSINEFPAMIVYPNLGEMSYEARGDLAFHDIVVDIYHARQYLPETVDAAKVWPDRVYAKLKADQTLAGAVAHVVWPIQYRFLPMQYNDQLHFGVRFTVKVKVLN